MHNGEFTSNFRKFWAKTIELATRTKSIEEFGAPFMSASEDVVRDPDLNFENIPSFAIEELSQHLINADQRVTESSIILTVVFGGLLA